MGRTDDDDGLRQIAFCQLKAVSCCNGSYGVKAEIVHRKMRLALIMTAAGLRCTGGYCLGWLVGMLGRIRLLVSWRDVNYKRRSFPGAVKGKTVCSVLCGAFALNSLYLLVNCVRNENLLFGWGLLWSAKFTVVVHKNLRAKTL